MFRDNKRLTREQIKKPWELTVVKITLLSVNKNMDDYTGRSSQRKRLLKVGGFIA